MTTGRINQVTILTPRPHPEATTKAQPPKGQKQLSEGARMNSSSATGTPFGLKIGSRDHPFAPTEFPKMWSTTEARAAHEGVDGTAIYTPREEDARGRSRRSNDQRIPNRAYPRKSGEILSQRPTIHRPQHCRKARPLGVQLSSPEDHHPPEMIGTLRFKQETLAAAGTYSGRSAPG
jgi:hypothetical protein